MHNFIRLCFILAFFGLLAWEVSSWDALKRFGAGFIGTEFSALFAIAVMIVTIILGFILNSVLNALLAPRYKPHAVLTPEERRAQADREAKQAIRQGRKGMAILIYEEASLFSNAMELAQELSDIPAQARISVKLGHLSRARRLFVQCGDLHMAGNVALLMKDKAEAQGYYRKAAENLQRASGDSAEIAMLYDRAGDYEKAADFYEQCSDLAKAAECLELSGQSKKAEKLYDQARAMEAFERKHSGGSPGEIERLREDQKLAAEKMAEQAEKRGDLLLAAMNFRKAGKLMEAATTFERIEEWWRAAKIYEELGLSDRAEMARMHAPEIETQESESGSQLDVSGATRGALTPPSPAEQSHFNFQPIIQSPQMPVFAALGIQAPSSADPRAQEDMLQLVRKGDFAAAAKRAEDANNWPMAAAFYECAGQYAKAADTYRQIGRIEEATQCLNRAGKRHESALLSIAEGREDKAVETLLESLKSDNVDLDKHPLSFLLELLVDWGLFAQARELLEKRLAPLHQLDPETARYYYQFALLLENAGHLNEALDVFQTMVSAGAVSEEVNQRIASLEEKIAAQEEAPPVTPVEQRLDPEREKGVREVLTRVIAEADAASIDNSEKTQTIAFQFDPSPHDVTAIMGKEEDVVSSLSLFGDPAPPDHFISNVTKTMGLTDVLDEENRREEYESRKKNPFAIGERYERKDEIARGGMGVVYEAVDTLLQRPVALKLLLGDFGATKQGLQQFLVEARAIAQLSHPNVVMIYDIGLMGKRHYIAMELVRGGSLGGLVKAEKSLSLAEAMRIFVEMARGLQTAHEAGIVHRDIKPANVLLTEKRQVKIVDFGLAKVAPENELEDHQTRFRTSGTPGYMAPEQIKGEPLLPRTDIYALGITLFQMIMGRAPHHVKNLKKEFDILNFQVNGEYPSLKELKPEVPDGIDKLYRYCAAKNPEERYQSVDAFLPTAEGWMHKLREMEETKSEEPITG